MSKIILFNTSKGRGINPYFMTKGRGIIGLVLTKGRGINSCFVTKERGIIGLIMIKGRGMID